MRTIIRLLIIIGVVLLFTLIQELPAGALPAFQPEGGIANEDEEEYREVLFISGEPILLTGKITESRTEKNGVVTHRITFKDLQNPEHKAKVTRSLTFEAANETRRQQTVSVTRLTSFSESVTVDRDRYSLVDYQFSHSAVTDQQPVVEYQSGNWNARKVYDVNGKAARVVIETWGSTVGYNHAWGSTTTQQLDGTVFFDGKVTVNKVVSDSNWAGTFQINLSHSRTRGLSYQENEPTQISFAGGYMETGQETSTLQYLYNLPALKEKLVDGNRRNQGTGAQQVATLPRQKRLFSMTFRDTQGHWAEGDITKLVGLGAFPTAGEYFGPRLSMTRGEFARAIVGITNLKLPEAPPKPKNSGVSPPEESVFTDVAVSDPFYRHYQAVSQAGIMSGTGQGRFNPDSPLTRAEAITIIIRALGLEGMAPVGPYKTDFMDDGEIPHWARDAVYVGARINLVKGNEYGYVQSDQVMTRAEAAAFLNRFISYLQSEMKAEYRERILNFR